jgi:hypothetical protein
MARRQPNDSLRAGTADRERVARVLQDAFGEGRLDSTELQQRLDAAYGAKTLGELRPLTADLPNDEALRPAEPVLRRTARGYRGLPLPLKAAWAVWTTVVGINVLVWFLVAITNHHWIYPWPVWVAGPWGVVLLVSTVAAKVSDGDRAE